MKRMFEIINEKLEKVKIWSESEEISPISLKFKQKERNETIKVSKMNETSIHFIPIQFNSIQFI